MLRYMDQAPTWRHQVLKRLILSPKIRERCPPLRPVLDRLAVQRAKDADLLQSLLRVLTAWENNGDGCRESFELQVRIYIDGYLGQLEVEENYVFSVATANLSSADWAELSTAFDTSAQCSVDASLAASAHATTHHSGYSLFAKIRSLHLPSCQRPA